MIEFTTQVDIELPPSEVFEFVADFEHTPKWNYFVIAVERQSVGPIVTGTTYHQIRKTDEQDYRIIELVPERSVAIETEPGSSPSFTIRYEFEAVASGTRVHDHWQLDTGRNALVERIGTRQVRAAVEENLRKLKELLETGSTRLQDGRVSTLS